MHDQTPLQEKLIKYLTGKGYLKTPEIAQAMRNVKREKFIPIEYIQRSYEDIEIPLPFGQVILKPSTVARFLELLQVKPGNKVLEIGTGSGWVTGLLRDLVTTTGYVVGTEINPSLIEMTKQNLVGYQYRNVEIVRVTTELGIPHKGPFDRIFVGGHLMEVPYVLMEQLAPNGIMVIPTPFKLVRVQKTSENESKIEEFDPVRVPPLLHLKGEDQENTHDYKNE